MMRNWGKAPHLVVMLNSLCFSAAFADEKPAEPAGSAPAATATPAGAPMPLVTP